MKVVDASVVVSAVTGYAVAADALADDDLYAPPHLDLEVLQTLRRVVSAGQASIGQAERALSVLATLGLTRYPVHGLGGRIWELRSNLTAYDAAYVAVAEALDCGLLTSDSGMARAPGVRCAVTLLPPRG